MRTGDIRGGRGWEVPAKVNPVVKFAFQMNAYVTHVKIGSRNIQPFRFLLAAKCTVHHLRILSVG